MPFYTILVYFTSKLVGGSEWALRTPSALIGVMTIVSAYIISLKIFTNKQPPALDYSNR